MAHRRARLAAVGLGICVLSLAHSSHTRCVVTEVKAVVRSRQVHARAGMHLMVAIGLLVPVHEILGHISYPALCSIEKAPSLQAL